jgi:hypothetical protein
MSKAAHSSIADFEAAVWSRRHNDAFAHLAGLLGVLSRTGGATPLDPRSDRLAMAFPQEMQEEAATRLASAVAELFADGSFALDARQFRALLPHHRWLATIFAASSFGNADFVLQRLQLLPVREAIDSRTAPDLFKLCLLYSMESGVEFDFEALFRRSPAMACGLGIALLATRLAATPRAHGKRETLLKWMTEALERLETLEGLPSEVFVDVWMHCSYADDGGKHDIKKSLNALIRKHLARLGHADLPPSGREASNRTVYVFLEWFHQTHSIMRTHSISLRALRDRYKLVGFGPEGMVDAAGRALFDEFHFLGGFDGGLSFLRDVIRQAEKDRPVAVYYPSVGMGLHSIFLVNLRLAPTQLIALGHPATTHSDKVDFVLVEEDYIGDPTVYSEKLVPLPKNALPYFEPSLPDFQAMDRRLHDPIRIAVPAAVMKLNPRFLAACRAVQERSPVRVEFHFMVGGTPGLLHVAARKSVLSQLPQAVVHPTRPYREYMRSISACDVFANPFPFGNTNGIVDVAFLGLPGVCLTGPEVHSHIDEGLFRRLGLPDFCIASTVEEYISSLLKLVTDETLRTSLSSRLKRERPDRVLYGGAPEAFAEAFDALVTRRSQNALTDSAGPGVGS